MDPRIRQLAKNLVQNSVCLKPGDKLMIDAAGSDCYPLVEALIDEAYAVGAEPYYLLDFEYGTDARLLRAFLRGASEEQIRFYSEIFLRFILHADAYIRFYAKNNAFEMSDVSEEKLAAFNKIMKKGVDYRVGQTRWCVLRWPTPSMAQSAEMSTEAFEDFYFSCCLLDYTKMSKAMDALVELMNRTDKVKIIGPGTDLHFSIKDIPALKCDGKMNIPDGEVYTAPVRDSVNGALFHAPATMYEGKRFSGICLEFKEGKIVSATCEQGGGAELNAILDRDEGARYIGEFALGVNPYILKPMMSILFDEKIAGSFHFTPGMCYDDAPNGNDSSVHWDMVSVQTPEYGGGEIYFDDVLIRRNGLFVLPELLCLNPENLK
ncbi:aminopeptidase [Patescibacteria group bacterium]|nr:aminopeptidase [Patescibacteria group bacterium]